MNIRSIFQRKSIIVAVLCIIVFAGILPAYAAVPNTVMFQGYLTDTSGVPLSGSHNLTFTIYDVDAAYTATAIWTSTVSGISVTNGVVNVELGGPGQTVLPANTFSTGDRYLGIAIDGGAEMTPRQKITSVGFALKASDADTLGGQAAGTFAASGHDHDAIYRKKYAKVAIVALSGGDYANPIDAVNNVSSGDNWCGAPSASNPCLVRIMPGVYSLAGSLIMQQFVDIEGSGESVTKLTGTVDSSTAGIVNGASNSEIRFITVENTGAASGNNARAIYNSNVSPRITHVTVTVPVSTTSNGVGVYNTGNSAPVLTGVTANISGGGMNYGIVNLGSSAPVMKDIRLNVNSAANSYGLYNNSSGAIIADGVIVRMFGSSIHYGIYNTMASPKINNADVSINGDNPYGIYSYGSSSPRITNASVTVTASSNDAYGIYNDSGVSIFLSDVNVTVSGAANNLACTSRNSVTSGALNNVSLSVTAAAGTNYAFEVQGISSGLFTLNGVTATASGGANNYGVFVNSTGNVKIDHSVITGTSNTVVTTGGGTVKIGNTRLEGGPVSGSGITCAGVYDENYSFSAGTCP